MRRIGYGGLWALGAVLLSAARANPSGLNPYVYQENMVIEQPSIYWLVPIAPAAAGPQTLWCNTSDPWDEIVKIDGNYVPNLTRDQVKAYFAGAHGWPLHLTVRPKSGGSRAVECFAHP